MKRALLLLAFITILAGSSFSQEAAEADTSWKTSGSFNINFTQVSLSNWAGGGESSISGVALFSYKANYLKDKRSWDNSIDLGFGLIKNCDDDTRKSEDRIELNSKLGHQIHDHWFLSVLSTFKSQFTEGFDYPNDSVKISDFLAPARIYLALGFDYKPKEAVSVYISPAAARWIIVNDQELADAGAYGVDPAEFDDVGNLVKEGERSRFEFGAMFKALYEKEVWENVSLKTKLELYSDYLEDPQNVDVDWEVLLNMKINSVLSAQISTQLIYDDNTKLPVEDTTGDGVKDKLGPRTQFKELFGIGLALKF
jgi:hypothetical protein